MEKKERIRQLLPLVDQIKDGKLRNGVIGVWVNAWEESEWEDVADCPFMVTLAVRDCSLIQHTNHVAAIALSMGTYSSQILNLPVDIDLLLAGALLHDVSKLLEMAPEKGKPGKRSAIGENLLHGAYGVHLALKAGLPLKVAHLISSHTPRVAQLPNVIEGVFLCYADLAAADSIHLLKGLPLWLKRGMQ